MTAALGRRLEARTVTGRRDAITPSEDDLRYISEHFEIRGPDVIWRKQPRRGRPVPVGKVAGRRHSTGKYRRIVANGQSYYAQRIAWFLSRGFWPPADMEIDHIDGDSGNNSDENLRLATRWQNAQNSRMRPNNKIGLKGVSAKDGKWFSRITKNGLVVHLGTFETPEAAHQAYCEAATALHGEFARLR